MVSAYFSGVPVRRLFEVIFGRWLNEAPSRFLPSTFNDFLHRTVEAVIKSAQELHGRRLFGALGIYQIYAPTICLRRSFLCKLTNELSHLHCYGFIILLERSIN